MSASVTGRKLAEQSYRASDVARLLQIPVPRLRELQATGEFPNCDFLMPGGGRTAERWLASTIEEAVAKWSPLGAQKY